MEKLELIDSNGCLSPQVVKDFAKYERAIKKAQEQEQKLREELMDAMEKHGIKKIETDELFIQYNEATMEERLDTQKVKRMYPEIANICTSLRDKKAFITIRFKKKGK